MSYVAESNTDRHIDQNNLKILSLTAPAMAEVNKLILSMAQSHVDLIPQISHHLIDSGGKRIRPMLTIASALLSGYQGKDHIQLAASVEFLHTATLLHDDVVDESDFRRGKLAARMLWGNQASVLVGDYLLGQAFKMMVQTHSFSALDILSSASAVIAEGEVLQLANVKNLEIPEANYMTVIKAKTAALFSAATEIGAVVAQIDDSRRKALRDFGMNLGLSFQLIDDALDYSSSFDAMGKNTGDDLREGKVTLPVILCYARSSEEEKKFWKRCVGNSKIDDADVQQAISFLHKHRTLDDTILKAKNFGQMAIDALAPFPSSEVKTALLQVVDYCIARIR